MIKNIIYIILIGFILYLFLNYTLNAQQRILKSALLNKSQKVFHSILIWVIPFFWFYLLEDIIVEKHKVMTKKKRDKMNSKRGGGFYESYKGIFGR